MSERDKLDNAKRKGKSAFWAGAPRNANPMRARDSRLYWEWGWDEEANEARVRGYTQPDGSEGE
jgi:ribosome modulation factor